MPKLLSINVSLPKEIQHKGKTVTTGIFKEPIQGKARVRQLNIDGDGQADLVGHGGEMRAVYVYSHDNYQFWEKELARNDFSMGQFGENFTVEGMPDHEIHIGDQFRIGTTLFEVSQPRVPCYKLAIKMEVEDFYARILKSGRLGFYFRVLEEGEVEAGDEIVPVKVGSDLTISQVNDLMYFDKENYQGFRNALKIAALSPGWKYTFEDRLAKQDRDKQEEQSYRNLLVEKKVQESETITSFYLTAEDGKLADFIAGQFLPLKLDIPGQYQSVYRTYTISSAPGDNFYRLSIKRELAPANVPNAYPGVSSNFFHDHVEVGTRLLAGSPRGKFYLHQERDSPVVLISAGVGITPMISMLEKLIRSGSDREIWFIHGTRNSKEQAFGEYLKELSSKAQKLTTYISYSNPGDDDRVGVQYQGKGRLDVELLKELLPGKQCDFYLCGPGPFMKSMFEGLSDWGVNELDIHYEFFGPASEIGNRSKLVKPKRGKQASDCCDDIEVTFVKSGIKAHWNPSYDSILELAESEGLSPDFSCRSGICQTCKTKLIEGEVDYDPEPLQTPENDEVLICCSKPIGVLKLDL